MGYLNATVHGITRMNGSRHGTPRFTVMTDHGQLVTGPEAQINYLIVGWLSPDSPNHRPLPFDAKIHVDRHQRIINIKTKGDTP